MSAPDRTTWGEVGALTSAGTVAATIFCCLPFATGIIGGTVAAFGASVAPLQPYLIAVSVALLGYSFYQAYRPDASCAADGCNPSSTVAGRRAFVWIVAAAVTVLLTASWWANWIIYWTL